MSIRKSIIKNIATNVYSVIVLWELLLYDIPAGNVNLYCKIILSRSDNCQRWKLTCNTQDINFRDKYDMYKWSPNYYTRYWFYLCNGNSLHDDVNRTIVYLNIISRRNRKICIIRNIYNYPLNFLLTTSFGFITYKNTMACNNWLFSFFTFPFTF